MHVFVNGWWLGDDKIETIEWENDIQCSRLERGRYIACVRATRLSCIQHINAKRLHYGVNNIVSREYCKQSLHWMWKVILPYLYSLWWLVLVESGQWHRDPLHSPSHILCGIIFHSQLRSFMFSRHHSLGNTEISYRTENIYVYMLALMTYDLWHWGHGIIKN